ncbi:MAG TPA: methyltransferase domain-containing protein [Methanoregulaceae archaeon]|nr:methyltransferase domain-containing protein [Methanoregulaceae archaeon]HQJ88089.1 methyltransferase domain-containing protein [Methanoregulaceae archaeon]
MNRHAGYVHGYSAAEERRLLDQADALATLLHRETRFPPGSLVLEAGCGTGAQTALVAAASPGARLVSVDRSDRSLRAARARLPGADLLRGDIDALPFRDGSFDHVFVCFVLEHLSDPEGALDRLRRLLRPGGTCTVIEGDHGSCFYHPETPEAREAWRALVRTQAALGGDALIGRRLYPLLAGAGFREVSVSPRMVYADESRPGVQEGFVQRTIVPMVDGARERAVRLGLVDPATFDRGVADLRRAGGPGGTFCYTFFRATGVNPG